MGRFAVVAKSCVQRLLNRVGYRVERLIQPLHPIDVFDLAVRKTIAERGREFFFVQIGAHDGSTVDPIHRYVTEYHWKGILVEPQPQVFEHLKKNYSTEPQLHLVNAAVSQENGEAVLYTVPTDGFPTVVQGMASFNRELLRKQVPAGTPIASLRVPTITLRSLLGLNDVSHVDLLQIDTEGFDYEIIKMIDFRFMRPAIIHYEHIHLSAAERTECEELLSQNSYRLHCSGQDTTAIIQSL